MPELVDDRYELLAVIASGGMATVWRARDRRLGREVAVKRPHPAPPGDPVQARVEREAVAAASLNHPNLVTVYDAGRDESGPFLVMELIDGPSLAGRQVDKADAIAICAVIADALSAVHAAGIVHRDVKPSNILMSERGPLLTDFGIALDADVTSQLTETGTVIGTANYAAPEQLAGEPASPRSDVFALGVILYELVSGQLPFGGTERHGPPPLLGDDHLDTSLEAALAADPTVRPDAATFAASLRSSAPTTPIVASAGTTRPLKISPIEESPDPAPKASGHGWLLGGSALLVLLLAGLALALSDDPSPAPPPSTIRSPSSTASPTTGQAPTTSVAPTTTQATTVAPEIPEARRALEAALGQAPNRELNPSDVKGLMERADRAIEAAAEGDDEKAGKELREIAKTIDEKLEGDVRQDSLASLVALADAIGVSLDG